VKRLTDREVIDGLSAGVVIAGHDEIVAHANPAACRMLRAAASACLGQPVRAGVFYYVALDRTRANLAMARMTIADTEKALEV
jgi:nitrogen fixation/metabolism regulation signal transduction histidine kinase